MSKQSYSLVFAVLLFTAPAAVVWAQKKSADGPAKPANAAKPSATAKPATHRVAPGLFKIEVKLDGVFESATMTEVVLRPEAWSVFKVVRALEQGTRVRKGQPIVWLDTKKIGEEIQGLKYAEELGKLAFDLASQQLRMLKKTVPLDLALALRTHEIADEELKYFLEVGRPSSEKSAEFSLKFAEFSVEYAEEELNQLEKMYKADDLTEETEEIILKRARRSAEAARYSLERSRERHDRRLKTTLPRQEEQLTESALRLSLMLQKAQTALPAALNQKTIEFEKSKFELKKSSDRLAKLRQDLDNMTVKAPADGIIYFGKCVRGKWTGGSTAQQQLRPGGVLTAKQPFMTIVQPQAIFVRVDVPEKELHHVRAGVGGKVVPTAFPDDRLPATVRSVSAIPVAAGKFDGRIRLGEQAKTAALMPGMACKVTLRVYEKRNALTVPAASVFTEEDDEDARYVYLARPNGKHQQRTVQIGRKTSKKIEIVKGLQAGDEILLKKPDEKSSVENKK